MADLSVRLGELALKNPVIPASGTFGFGYEMARFYDLDLLGAISLKGTTLHERYGNPTPRIAECREGLLNAIGLQNPGVHAVIDREIPRLREVYHGPVIANISGFALEESRRPRCSTPAARLTSLKSIFRAPTSSTGAWPSAPSPKRHAR